MWVFHANKEMQIKNNPFFVFRFNSVKRNIIDSERRINVSELSCNTNYHQKYYYLKNNAYDSVAKDHGFDEVSKIEHTSL